MAVFIFFSYDALLGSAFADLHPNRLSLITPVVKELNKNSDTFSCIAAVGWFW